MLYDYAYDESIRELFLSFLFPFDVFIFHYIYDSSRPPNLFPFVGHDFLKRFSHLLPQLLCSCWFFCGEQYVQYLLSKFLVGFYDMLADFGYTLGNVSCCMPQK